MRLAWFSPVPPSPSGIAAYTAELVPRLTARLGDIDVFVPRRDVAPTSPGSNPDGRADQPLMLRPAEDFVWRARRAPYDLTVYQLGNATYHDYMWAYLFRHPGLVVLHDAQLGQSRALALTSRLEPRIDDYLAEFEANHPGAPRAAAELLAAGGGGQLFSLWPHVKLVLEAARLAVVHSDWLRDELGAQYPAARIEAVPMGVADPGASGAPGAAGAAGAAAAAGASGAPGASGEPTAAVVRARHGIPEDAVVVAAYGGITPEKGIEPLLRVMSEVCRRRDDVHLLLVGQALPHYDVGAEIERWGIAARTHVAGFVPDAELPGYLAAADICSCLRWPTNRETSASWLRCLAAGRPTLVSGLRHLTAVPALDPRGWRLLAPTAGSSSDPVAVSIELIDERHALQLALDRLVDDRALCRRLGNAARRWWQAHHTLDHMVAAYEGVIDRALALDPPVVDLPPHLLVDGTARARAILMPFGETVRSTSLM